MNYPITDLASKREEWKRMKPGETLSIPKLLETTAMKTGLFEKLGEFKKNKGYGTYTFINLRRI